MFNSKFSIGVLKHPGYNIDFGDDTPAPQQITQQTSNIPDWMVPYVENMLGATQNQLFNMDSNGQITGMKGYKPYSTNMNDYVAGFSPLQKQAQNAAANLQMPGQFQQGSNFATAGGLGSYNTAQQAGQAGNNYYGMATDPNSVRQFMNPYIQDALNPQLDELRRQSQITQQQQQKAATGAGAFGGSREALMAAENNRNLGQIQNQAIGKGYSDAFNAAQQAQQFGANLGLQGQQTALQGYNQVGQAGALLGQLGAQQLAAQQGIIGTQNQIGAQQTAAEQAKINQAIQDYANAQQWPMMQLGFMSNMTRGLPMNSPTTATYTAQPSAGTQALGAVGSAISAANAVPKAKGGILSYDIGGSVEHQLSRMPTDKLDELKASAQSKFEKDKIDQIKRERGPEGLPELAPGGIVAFKVGDKVISDDQQAASDAYEAWQKTAFDNNPNPKSAKDYDYPTTTLNEFGVNAPAKDDSKLVLGRSGPASDPTRDRLNELGYSNTYNGLNWQDQLKKPATPAAAAKAPVEDIEARKLAWELANKKETPSAPAAPANTGIKAAGPTEATAATKTTEDPYAESKKMVASMQDIDTKIANGLRDIYQNPEMAPYAKARFDQFQSEIDGAKEKDRQRFWLHAASMFATMATQPGGVIKAAMGALANEVPLYTKDKEKAEDHLDAIKKAQYDITQAEIARRVGDFKTEMELKQNALKTGADVFKDIFKDTTDRQKIEAEIKHWKAVEANSKEANDIQRAQVNKEPSELTTLKAIAAHPELKAVKEDLTLGPAQERTKAALEKTYASSIDSDLPFEDWLNKHGLTYAGRVAKDTKHDSWGRDVTIK